MKHNIFDNVQTNTNLNIFLGHLDDEVYFVDAQFNAYCQLSWLEDSFVHDVITDLCNATSISKDGIIRCPDWYDENGEYVMSYRELSSGVKAVILIYEGFPWVCASHCGDNCAKWILAASKLRKVFITLNYRMHFNEDVPITILNNMHVINTWEQLHYVYISHLQMKMIPSEALYWFREHGLPASLETTTDSDVWKEHAEEWYRSFL